MTFDGTKAIFVCLVITKISRSRIIFHFSENGADHISFVPVGRAYLDAAVERKQMHPVTFDQSGAGAAHFFLDPVPLRGGDASPVDRDPARLGFDPARE